MIVTTRVGPTGAVTVTCEADDATELAALALSTLASQSTQSALATWVALRALNNADDTAT